MFRNNCGNGVYEVYREVEFLRFVERMDVECG